MRKKKVYLTLNTAERRLLIRGLLFFRNKVISEGIEAIDIDQLIEKVMKKRNSGRFVLLFR